MALDIYATGVLNRVVDSLIRPQTALLNMFFRSVQQSTEETIYFDVEESARRIAPFVHPTLAGRMVEGLGFKTNNFQPAYVKDKRIFDPDRALKRQIGETIGGNASPASRVQANLNKMLLDQQDMLNRRFEVMASEIVRLGQVTITGDGYPTVVVDFLRNAAHTVTLSGAARWGQAGIVPIELIEDWSTTMLQNSGAVVDTVIMDTLAFRLFTADTKSKELLLNTSNNGPSRLDIVHMAEQGLAYQGTIGNVDYYAYQDWYINDAGTEVPMIPINTCILGSRSMDGVRHFGAIKDEEAGFQARESYTKSWVIPDPSVRYLLTQSAPIMVPYRPDASFAATVN